MLPQKTTSVSSAYEIRDPLTLRVAFVNKTNTPHIVWIEALEQYSQNILTFDSRYYVSKFFRHFGNYVQPTLDIASVFPYKALTHLIFFIVMRLNTTGNCQ